MYFFGESVRLRVLDSGWSECACIKFCLFLKLTSQKISSIIVNDTIWSWIAINPIAVKFLGNIKGYLGVILDDIDPTKVDVATGECLNLFFGCFIYGLCWLSSLSRIQPYQCKRLPKSCEGGE